jgi:hypothetical protein
MSMLMKLIPFYKPQFALVDQLPNQHDKLWVYFSFVKPGRQTFLVNTKDNFYVHNHISEYRREDCPKFFMRK